MHDLLRERILRKLEVLPEQQLYQVLDYIEFMESKYAADQAREPDALQRFAERLEDGMRIRNVAPKVMSGTLGVLGSAHKMMKNVSDTAKSVSNSAAELLTPAPAPPKPPANGSDSGPTT
jgi:hypothetical protein